MTRDPVVRPGASEARLHPGAAGLAASAVAIGALTLLSKLLGFGREAALAAAFGATHVSDAYFVALILPALVAGLIGQVFATAGVPVFTAELAAPPPAGPARAPSGRGGSAVWSSFHVALAAGLLMAAGGALLADSVVRALAPGLPAGALPLAAAMTRILTPAALFAILAGWATAVLHSRRQFLIPAATGLPYNVILIAVALAAGQAGAPSLLAWGTAAAIAAQFLVQWPAVRRSAPPYRRAVDLRDPGLARLAALSVPILAASGMGHVNVIVDRWLASGLAEGTISLMNYALRAAQLPLGLLGAPIITVLYPLLAERAATRDADGIRQALVRGLAAIGLVLAPVTAVMILEAPRVLRLLFERGAFTADDTARAAPVLIWYAVGLPFVVGCEYLVRALYALDEGRTALRLGLVASAVNLGLNLLLVGPLGAPGLALANSAAAALACVLLAAALRRRLGGLGGRRLLAEGLRIAAATAVTAAAVAALARGALPVAMAWLVGVMQPLAGVRPGLASFLLQACEFGLLAAAGAAVYAAACALLRVEEFAWLVRLAHATLAGLRGASGAGGSGATGRIGRPPERG